MHRAVTVGATLVVASVALAGPLNPPGGPVAPTSKTLQQVEPRTPIAQADIPLTITQPGSYYLVEGVTATGLTAAISIAGDDVMLDLNGFSVTCVGTSIGVRVTGSRNHVVTNGFISGATSSGIGMTGGVGGRRVSDVHVRACRFGISVTGGVVERCSAVECTSSGISVTGGTARDCYVSACPTGFVLSSATALACTAQDNSASGFDLDAGSIAIDCVAEGGGGTGFDVADGSTARGCTANRTLNGFVADASFLLACNASFCNQFGFLLNTRATAIDCHASNNASAGFESFFVDNRIDRCSAVSNDTGFSLLSGDSMLTRCYASNNDNNFFVSGSTYGPIVIGPGDMGSLPNGTHPWANVEGGKAP